MTPLLFFILAFQQHQTVIVTGTYEPLSLEEMDRAIRSLPVRENRILFDSLAAIISLDPSVDLRGRAPNGIQADVSIRGGSFGETLVLLNGLRLNDAQSGHHNMDIPVPLDGIQRVEILRGSGSTMYGSDAAGGVINVVTAPPEGTEIRLRAAGGSFGTNEQQATLGGVFGKISERLTFSRDFSSGFAPDRDYRNLQLSSDTHTHSTLGPGSLMLAYMDHPFGADQFYGNYPSWEDTKTWFAGGQQTLREIATVSFAYRRHSDLFVLYRDQPEIFTNHHSDESWQLAIRREDRLAPTARLFYGVEGLHESVVSTNLGNHARSRAAAYVAYDLRALRRFSLSISAREELYRSWSATFSPTVAVGSWLSRTLKTRASASRAFRVPSYTDLYYHDPANLGNPYLRPERAWSYEAGLEWIPSSRLRGELTLFERREQNGIDYFRASPTDIWRALNIQNLHFSGVEAGLQLGGLDLRYTGLRGTQDTIPLGATKYTFNYPRHSGVLSWHGMLGQSAVARTRIGVLYRIGGDRYALWDLSIAGARGHVRPFLQLSNITSTRYEEIQGVMMPGRSIIGGFEFVIR